MAQLIADLAQTPASVSTVDGVFVGEGMLRADVNNAFRALSAMVKSDFARSANTITAASVFTLASISTGDYIRMAPYAGQSITSFGPATDGLQKWLESTGAQILRNGASLSVQGGADLTLAAGDLLWARRDQSVWKARIFRADGMPVGTGHLDATSISASQITTSSLSASHIVVNGQVEFGPRPSFFASKSAASQSSLSASHNVTFATETFDVGAYFASDTYTPPAGKYRLTTLIPWQFTSAGTALLTTGIRKNTTSLVTAIDSTSTTNTQLVSAVVDANGTDAFTVYVTIGGTGVLTITQQSYFCGERI